jgi:hypothetical protein
MEAFGHGNGKQKQERVDSQRDGAAVLDAESEVRRIAAQRNPASVVVPDLGKHRVSVWARDHIPACPTCWRAYEEARKWPKDAKRLHAFDQQLASCLPDQWDKSP